MSLESLFQHIIFTEHQAEENRRVMREGGPAFGGHWLLELGVCPGWWWWCIWLLELGVCTTDWRGREDETISGVCTLEGKTDENSHANCC